ncbi:MAG: FecR family protein, partial [Methylobacter sp.]|nr:FecR family protein [Methylobacter sp.]
PLEEVIAELDRYHRGAIVITDAKLAKTRITGNYKLEDTAAIIRALAGIAGAQVINLSPYLTLLKS